MSPSNLTMTRPTELDDDAAWSAYWRTHVSDLTDTITLRDGSVILMRAIRPDDVELLRQFHSRLSLDTIVMRYFRVAPELYPHEARRLTHLDYDNRMALVATTGAGVDERIVGVVRYERVTASEAELAFVVEDQWQGRGISSKLLSHLLRYARAQGYERMMAVTMSTNVRMRAVITHAGFAFTSSYADGCVTLKLDLSTPAGDTSLASKAAQN